MWDLIVSVPDHYLSFFFLYSCKAFDGSSFGVEMQTADDVHRLTNLRDLSLFVGTPLLPLFPWTLAGHSVLQEMKSDILSRSLAPVLQEMKSDLWFRSLAQVLVSLLHLS